MRRGVVMLIGVLAVLAVVLAPGLVNAAPSADRQPVSVTQAGLPGAGGEQAQVSTDASAAVHVGSAAAVLILGIASVAVASRRRAVPRDTSLVLPQPDSR